MEYYTHSDLTEIVERTADIFEMEITHEAASELALRSRGTPRIANRLLKRVRDFAQIMGDGLIDDVITDKALTMLDVDHEGLDYVDQKILRTMIEMYGGGPVGLGTLSVNIAEGARDGRRHVRTLPNPERLYHANTVWTGGNGQGI